MLHDVLSLSHFSHSALSLRRNRRYRRYRALLVAKLKVALGAVPWHGRGGPGFEAVEGFRHSDAETVRCFSS